MSEADTGTEPPNMFLASQEMLRQMFQTWEQLTLQYVDGLLRHDQFLDLTGKALENSLQFKQQVDRMVEATVANMQIPTRSDMDRMLRKLSELEALLRDMNEKLERLLEQK